MPINFRERQSVIKELANQYKGAKKLDKGLLIGYLQTLTDFNCSYADRALRTAKIDRLLVSERKRLKLKGLTGTKPGPLKIKPNK